MNALEINPPTPLADLIDINQHDSRAVPIADDHAQTLAILQTDEVEVLVDPVATRRNAHRLDEVEVTRSSRLDEARMTSRYDG